MQKILIKIISMIVCVGLAFSLGICVGKYGKNSNSKDNIGNLNFATEKQKNVWKEPVKELVAELKKQEVPGSFSMNAFAYVLFDLNLDGVPELVQVKPGGSAGNVFYEGYNIYTGLCVATFNGGNFNGNQEKSWCVYYNRDTEELQNICVCITRGGADSRFKTISRIVFNDEKNIYDDETMFYNSYFLDVEIVDDKLVEKEVNVKFKLGDEEVDLDEYNQQYDYFLENYIRVYESAMEFVYVEDLEKVRTDEEFAEMVTEELFSTSQKFVMINN